MPSSITGAAQTGFTSPTYTCTNDTAPNVNSKQVAITALGGTQTGVSVHSAASPFTVTAFRPAQIQILGQPNPVTGLYKNFPVNRYKVKTRKGAVPAANVAPKICTIETDLAIVAGCDTYSPSEVRAAISAHIGFLWQLSASIGDTSVTAIL